MLDTLIQKGGAIAVAAGLTFGVGTTVLSADASVNVEAHLAHLANFIEQHKKGGDYLPLTRIQPKYPKRAFDEGIGGHIILEFTVSKDGTVAEDTIKVLEAKPEGYFEASVKKAAAQFQYKPKTKDGTPQDTPGVRYRFHFSLGDD